jgi:DNA polymerase delta subunit 1
MVLYKLNYSIKKEEYSRVIYGDTDSCMVELKTKAFIKYDSLVKQFKDNINLTIDEENKLQEYKTKAIEEAFEQGKILADKVTKALFKHPINLEFEKVYTNFLILSKKRYLGNYYGTNPYTIDKVEKKGVVLKRRDNPEIVKKVYSGVVNPLLEHGERGISISINFLKNQLENLMNNNVDLNDLVITKSLVKGYGKLSNSGELITGQNDYKNFNIPHVALAHKMRQRDPGSAPNIGDRINYIFVEIPENPKAKLYEKVEDLQVAIDKKLKIDYLYYVTNQIHNPVSEILKILVAKPEKIFLDATKEYLELRKKQIEMQKPKNKLEKGQQSILKWIKPKQ